MLPFPMLTITLVLVAYLMIHNEFYGKYREITPTAMSIIIIECLYNNAKLKIDK